MNKNNFYNYKINPRSIFKIENFISENLYFQLRDGFKDYCKEDFSSKNFLDKKNLKYCFNSEMDIYNKILDKFQAANELHEITTSKKFFYFFIKKLYLRLLHSKKSNIHHVLRLMKFPSLVKESNNFLDNSLFNFFLNKIKVTLEYSYILNGGRIVPHTDDTNKLLSLMLYFPKFDLNHGTNSEIKELIKKEKKIGTTFWNSDFRNYLNEHQEQNKEEIFKVKYKKLLNLPFEGRHLFGFIKSDLSWHSVEKIDLHRDYVRNSININFRFF